MVKLYTFPPAFGLRNVSPFCLKVEMALAHLGRDYEIVEEGNPQKAPKGKLPFVVINGVTLADSELILAQLDKDSGGQLYGDLTADETARGAAFTRLIEDHLYWIMVASRWLDDAWFDNVRQGFFGGIPGPVRPLVTRIARRSVRQTYNLHGLGRHSREEQAGFARRDFEALGGALAQSDYIAGQRLTVHDFAVASLLAGIYDQQPITWINPIADEFPALRDYAERVQRDTGVYCRK
jgi:glutathione S-transferase